MVNQQALLHAFRDYARVLLRPYEVGSVLDRLTEQVVEVLGLVGAGVSLSRDEQHLTFVTATDERIAAIEEEQIAHREGPCHEAFRTGETITVSDLADDHRWPRYRAAALRQGVGAALGIPMPVDELRIGALDLYRKEPGGWSDEDVETAQTLADMASGYILNADSLDRSKRLTAQLQHALDSRVVVEQAKGILAERHGVETLEAFRRLRAHARRNSTAVHDISRQVIEGVLDPWTSDPPD